MVIASFDPPKKSINPFLKNSNFSSFSTFSCACEKMRKYNKNFKSCHQSIIIPLGLLMIQAPPIMREKSPSEILTARLAL